MLLALEAENVNPTYYGVGLFFFFLKNELEITETFNNIVFKLTVVAWLFLI